MKLLEIILMLFVPLASAIMSDWSYSGERGAHNWNSMFRECAGKWQSPVNIDKSTVIYNKWLGDLNMEGHNMNDTQATYTLYNTGHTVKLDIVDSSVSVRGGDLLANYTLAQLHFHWGSNDTQGSEHTLDGKSYGAELHLVHYRDDYATIGSAVDKSHGLAVLGFFIQIVEKNNTNYTNFIESVSKISNRGDSISLAPFRLSDLLPATYQHFYRYEGSLTTPPCHQSVTWSVFTDPIQISAAQMSVFRSLMESNVSTIEDNFRPVQPIHHRPIYVSLEPQTDDDISGAASLRAQYFLVPLTVLVMCAIRRMM